MRITCCVEDVGGDFVMDGIAEHEIASYGDSDVQRVSEDIGVVYCAGIFGRVAHVAVDVGKDGVATPRGHEKAEGEGEIGPALRPQGGDYGGAERAGGGGFEETIHEDENYN